MAVVEKEKSVELLSRWATELELEQTVELTDSWGIRRAADEAGCGFRERHLF